ncbi:MAG: HNH endonuclease signature motif containing protein [Pseudomonadota bacterium]
MRIRTIKPEFWTDPFMVGLPHEGRLMFLALISCSDDHGFIHDEIERLALEVMPRESSLDVDDWVQFFISSNRLEYHVTEDGYSFLKVANWEKHQRVDKPGKSKIFREGSRKLAIPNSVRREVAEKYGCKPGERTDAACYYCGSEGRISWHRLHSGRPSGWVTFPGLELDHLEAEFKGGENACENIVLACQHCNRSKGTKDWFEFLSTLNDLGEGVVSREDSRGFSNAPRRNREQGTGNREQGRKSKPLSSDDDTRSDVETVFETWKQETGHKQTALDEKRKKLIRNALKLGYSVDQLILAVKGMMQTPHNLGDNERGQRYDGVHIVFKDADQIDRFIRNYHSPPAAQNKAESLHERNKRVAAEAALEFANAG